MAVPKFQPQCHERTSQPAFLAAINIYFGGNRALSKDVMSEFFHNLSMPALSISEDSIVLKFDATKKLNKNINDSVNADIHVQKKGTIVGDER